MKKQWKAILCAFLSTLMLPLPVQATGNTAPAYIGSDSEIFLSEGEAFHITKEKLQQWFTDADGDALTYWIKVNNSRYMEIQDKCMYIPEEDDEAVVLTFKADDGKDSAEISLPINMVKSAILQLKTSAKTTLQTLIIHSGYNPSNNNVLLRSDDSFTSGQLFDPQMEEYRLEGTFYDTTPSLSFRADSESAEDVTLLYQGDKSKSIKTKNDTSILVGDLLTAGENTFQIKAGDKTYTFHVAVIPTLKTLSTEGLNYWDKSFAADKKEYTIELSSNTKTLNFSAEPLSEGCTITYNGATEPVVDIENCDEVEIVVSKDGISNTYTVHLEKKAAKTLTITAEPSDALITVTDHLGNKLQPDESNMYSGLFADHEYKYNVSLSGYKAQEGIVPAEGGTLPIQLEKVTGAQPQEVSAQWKNFRGSDNNMAIVDISLPTEAVAAKWITKLGTGYTDAPSVQIIVDNALVVMGGKKLYKLDMDSGEVLQSAEMADKFNWGYTPPTYGAGMIFVPLANGTIQAFNAKTLESLWIFEDSIGGQSLSPIVYSDGYLYTGFWKQEKKEANYVCIDVTDEDTTKNNEAKSARWVQKHNGGFYWAGGIVIGNALIVGSDDGQAEGDHGTSTLYAFDKYTGEIITSAALSGAGDQRSSIAYDEANQRIYFTTKGGYLYCATVDPVSGKFSDLKRKSFGMQSTSTPVVYNNRLYFGVGAGFSEGYLAVADANTLDILFKIKMKGYPQGSVLLSTAYESSGYLYLYLSYNSPPGGISMIKVKSNCSTSADVQLTEIYDASGYSQYCISSLICDTEGTIYYKNDSGALFAIAKPTHQNVIDQIDAIGSVTADSEGKILAAREAYDALSTTDKAKVTNYSKLTEAEETLEELLTKSIKEVEELISVIGKVTLKSKDKITAARKAYYKLTAEEKQKVTNYKTLTSAEKTYEELVEEAISEVEKLIKAIGTVTKDSKTSITKARTAYDALSEELQEKVENYDDLVDAEKAFKKLSETTTTATTTTTTTTTQTVTTQRVVGSSKEEPEKSELLQLQEKLEAVSKDLSYDEALSLLRSVYTLDEGERLALEDSKGFKTLQDIIAEHAHTDEKSGVSVEGLPWNIAVIVNSDETLRVQEDMEERLTNAKILGLWNISLQNVLSGEHYTPDDTLKLKIPSSLLKDKGFDNISIVHYNEVAEIEVLSTTKEEDALTCDVVEFSYYGIAGFMESTEVEETEEETTSSSWLIWVALSAVGLAALAVLLYFRFGKKEEEAAEDTEFIF